MDAIKGWWPLILFGMGATVASLKYLFAHSRKHQLVDARLQRGDECFEENASDHAEILIKLDRQDKRSAAVRQGVLELLVLNGLREPGQGINGDDD